MWMYRPPLRDMRFVLDELLDVSRDWANIPLFSGFDRDLAPQILEEAGKFVVQALAPLNSSGDLEGCRYEDGRVNCPAGFAAAYELYCEAGWPALACDVESGGQGLPQVLDAAVYEMLNATNHAWTMYPGLTHGAYDCVRAHAPEDLKAAYLPKIVSGEWLSTMCLTEPQAGSDVGLIRTRAEIQPDGSYSITGSKIFISGGEHDLTPNIVHLVLARLPDAPVGTRGVSMFLVPKYLPGSDTQATNGVRCDGIEKKMGIKGSATCVMSFNAAKGWMIGEPNRGLAAMFVMMNSARLHVGLQGLAHGEMAYQNALRYATERLQMRAVVKPDGVGAAHPSGADPIALQPSIRKTLLTLRAFVEGARALGYWGAHLLDMADHHPEPRERAQANDWLSLLTPIVKSFFTESGFSLASAALQVWGGYGYIHDYGIEQSVRDSRIAMIYEGTNEIQAIDLLVRKIIGDRGDKFASLLQTIRDESARCKATPACESFGEALAVAEDAMTHVTAALVAESGEHPEFAYHIATDYLRAAGVLLLGSMWAKTARLSIARIEERFYAAKLETARFYFDYLMPELQHRLALIERRVQPLPWLEAEG